MNKPKSRNHYSAEFKAEALKLAEKTSVTSAAKELSLYESQLYNWRTAAQRKLSTSQRENTLAIEVAKLKRKLADQTEELDILKKAATYFAKNLKN